MDRAPRRRRRLGVEMMADDLDHRRVFEHGVSGEKVIPNRSECIEVASRNPKRRALFHLRAISLAAAGRARRSAAVRRQCDVAGQRGLTHCRSHFVSARCDAVDSDCPRNCPCGESWGQHVREQVVTFYAGGDYSRFSRSLRTRRRRHEWRRASCLDATRFRSRRGHRECARSMAITSAFRALASGVPCEMLRAMALVEALGLRTKKPRRDLSDVMNSVSLGD